MKRSHRICAAFLALVFCAGCQNAASQGKKPNVVILATGGTIAGAAGSGTQSAYTSGAVTQTSRVICSCMENRVIRIRISRETLKPESSPSTVRFHPEI